LSNPIEAGGSLTPINIFKKDTLKTAEKKEIFYPRLNTVESNKNSKTPDRDFHFKRSISKTPVRLRKETTYNDKNTIDLSFLTDKKETSFMGERFRKINSRTNKTEEISIIDNLIDGLSRLKTIIMEDEEIDTNPTM
jgi:hypothetical protein